LPGTVVTEITAEGVPFLGASTFDLGPRGYEQAEYMLSGAASAYVRSDGGVSVAGEADYATRLLVYRPSDPATFNGTVWVEWLNVSPGYDMAVDWMVAHTELMRAGAAWVGVSAQSLGVHGSEAFGTGGLVGTNPDRYGGLVHPGDRYSYDIYSQAGEAVRTGAGTILEDLIVDRMIAIGCSQSAYRLFTYINDVDPLAQIFDGFFVHARGGFSAPLDVDDEPITGIPEHPMLFRAERRVPVTCVQAETDVAFGGASARQDDDETYALWEIAGTSHGDAYFSAVAAIDSGVLPIGELAAAWRPAAEFLGEAVDKPINAGPQHYVMNAAVSHFDEWVRHGIHPPHAPRLEFTDGGFVTDRHGNVLGGIRTPHVEVPTAVLSGLGNGGGRFGVLTGTTTPFDAAQLAALYPSRTEYLARFDAATDAAIADGFLLAADADEINAVAAENSPL
jgi:hypothetical protein